MITIVITVVAVIAFTVTITVRIKRRRVQQPGICIPGSLLKYTRNGGRLQGR